MQRRLLGLLLLSLALVLAACGEQNDAALQPSAVEACAPWDAATVYLGGDTATFDGKTYEAKWWTRGENPAEKSNQWDVWKVTDGCGGTDPNPDPPPPPNPDPDPKPCNLADGFRIVGYMPSWQGSADDVQYDKLTHINYSFLIPNPDGSLQPLENAAKLETLVTKGHAQGVKVLIAVGGWLNGNDSAFTILAANPETRAAFIDNLMDFVERYDLDGIDMDWEYPREGNEPQDYARLMNELGERLRAEGKLLTAAVVVAGWNADGVLDSVFDDVDFLNIMAYDGPDHSTIAQATGGLDYWLERGLPASKAVLGVPFYSRYEVFSYADLLAQGADPYADEFRGRNYNGITTIKAKTELARERGSGIMIWELSNDTNDPATSLLNAINQAAGEPCDDEPSPDPDPDPEPEPSNADLDDPVLKDIAMQIVATAENSSLDWRAQFSYIEDIGDGRGYTGGIIGFTSGTSDMLMLVEEYTRRKPGNVLANYLPALRRVNGSASHAGLDPNYTSDWRSAAQDPVFRQAQEDERDRLYFNPAVNDAKGDGLRALGQFAYYDAAVMHGHSGMRRIRNAALRNARPPAQGGDEVAYLDAFLDARVAEMRTEAAHLNTSRVDTAQRVFLRQGKLNLERPLEFKVYGDSFRIP